MAKSCDWAADFVFDFEISQKMRQVRHGGEACQNYVQRDFAAATHDSCESEHTEDQYNCTMKGR